MRKPATNRPARPGPRWRAVQNPRNSTCGSARLADLDWSTWWQDGSGGACYLHVRRNDPELDGGGPRDETWHRVHCRLTDHPRLALREGKLWWLVDQRSRAPAP